MDVLQLLKSEFREIRSELSTLMKPETNETKRKKILGAFGAHLAWESDYLLPELTHIATRGDALLEKYQQSLRQLSELNGKAAEKTSDIVNVFDAHKEIVEEKILPFMRQKIPTVDREELYHVFADAKQELLAQKGGNIAVH